MGNCTFLFSIHIKDLCQAKVDLADVVGFSLRKEDLCKRAGNPGYQQYGREF